MNNKKYNPIHYVISEEKDSHRTNEEGLLLVYEPGWYFWDHEKSYRHGPFISKKEAEAAFETYNYS